MSEPQPPLPQTPPPLDYQPPQPREGQSGAAKIVGFVVGVLVGPIALGVMFGFGASASNSSAGAVAAIVLYVAIAAVIFIQKPLRTFSLGLICGPLILLFAVAIFCGSIKG